METISNIETARITVNPNNPRSRIEDVSDLVSSIKSSGLLQPITVRWTKQLDADGMPTGYEVIAGSRRLTACKILKLEKVPCIVIQANDAEAYKLATMENIVRENMTAVDEANAVAKLYAQGRTRQEIAAIFGKSVRWAEGRRKIVSLGDKAMEALAAGTINLGHAEVLTLCAMDRVERFLDAAKWHTPAELKNMILSERKRLDRAPFNVQKICKKCENRSDCQQEIFSDVKDSYCLDEDCYKSHIAEEVERIRKNFEAQGWQAVPEDEIGEAKGGWSSRYINASSTYEYDQEEIKELKKDGVKPRFWINKDTAENGLVFRKADAPNTKTNEIDSHEDRQLNAEIREAANKLETADVEKCMRLVFASLDKDQIAVIVDQCTDYTYKVTEADEDGETHEIEESPLLHIGEKVSDDEGNEKDQFTALIDYFTDQAVWYDGTPENKRSYYGLEPREKYMEKAKAQVLAERERLQAEADSAANGE